MAWTASGFFVATHIDQWDDTALSVDLTSEVDLKAAFYGSSVTPDFGAAAPAYNAGVWASGQSSGAGYTAGGIAVTGTTLAIASGSMKFDADNFSIPNSTITAEGYLLYDDSTQDRAVLAVWFGGPESTQDGTFLVTHDAAGIAALDLTP
ncbi:hypothetical protein [Streptosporangium minutum]|uniref:Uncharacterized protein n=1 Tax=Streptosporangium minutum TaxID=569862 RepID=A0A243RXQ1_9ACTN|nr:hypothetical protein [Streptosporangium minutum]OUC99313.1 hypothetical protein CA984_03645 [Streptosporangium minutum]